MLHGAILLGDSYMPFDLVQIAIPFTSAYRPVPVGLGVAGFYLMLLLSVSFYTRRYIGQRRTSVFCTTPASWPLCW